MKNGGITRRLATVVALLLTAVMLLSSCGEVIEPEPEYTGAELWNSFIQYARYSPLIADTLESQQKFNLSHTKCEWALCDVDRDMTYEMFMRICEEVNGKNRAMIFVFALEDGTKENLAGQFTGTDYPIYYPSKSAFEAPADISDGIGAIGIMDGGASDKKEGEREFFRLDGLKCVPAFSLYEENGGYFIKENGTERSLDRAEYNSYFSDGEFLEWKSFYFKYQYQPSTDPDYSVKAVEPFGTVPEEFTKIVEENAFGAARWYNGGIVLLESSNDFATVTVLDEYGNVKNRATVSDTLEGKGGDHSVVIGDFAIAKDGGIAVLHTSVAASADGNTVTWRSTLSAFSSGGEEIWSCELMTEESHFGPGSFIQADGCYYCFVSRIPKIPEGGSSDFDSGDILIIKVSDDGSILASREVAGSMGEMTVGATDTEDGVTLTVMSASKDGDFEGVGNGDYNYYDVSLSEELEILSVERSDKGAEMYMNKEFGVIDGRPVRASDEIFEGFDAGEPTLVVDYGDFYLVVSMNGFPSMLSSLSFKSSVFQTVYSAYSKKDGELLWRAVTDGALGAYLSSAQSYVPGALYGIED